MQLKSPKFIASLFFSMGFFAILLSLLSFEKSSQDVSINLRWNKAYEAEKWWNVRTGLMWSFSFIGANLPPGSFDKAVSLNADSTMLTVHFSLLGFSEKALSTLAKLNEELKHSEEYQQNNAIDLGRWLVYVIYSGDHYFQLVDAPKTLAQFKAQHEQSSTKSILLNKSSVSYGTRKIVFHEDTKLNQIYCIASEGHYDSLSTIFHEKEFETIDFLPNTQPRFAIYDSKGNLKNSGNTQLSQAGKIGKCMWCHESKIEKLFTQNQQIKGFLSPKQFQKKVESMNSIIYQARRKQKTDLLWFNEFDHTQAELLYISFMQSSAGRISKEWNMPKENVLKILSKIKTAPYTEFPFLGELYDRKSVDSLALWPTLKVPDWVREPSKYESE